MSVEKLPVILERYFFPTQVVKSYPNHDENGSKNKNNISFSQSINKIDSREDFYAIQVDLSLDKENSENPPYDFQLSIVGYFFVNNPELSEEKKEQSALSIGTQILIGSLRERLAILTQSAPWGVFYLNVVTLINNGTPIQEVKPAIKKSPKKKRVKIIK